MGFFEREPLALQLQPLAVDCLSAVCRRDSPLARRERLTWADLSDLTIINLKRGTTLERQIDETLSAIGRHLEPNYEVSFLNTALAMVQHPSGTWRWARFAYFWRKNTWRFQRTNGKSSG